MHRISNGTQVASLPTPAAVSGTPGYATPGVVGSLAATTIDPDAYNAQQEEIVGVVLAAGLTLSKTNNAQLLQAIQILTGAPQTYAGNPNGHVAGTAAAGAYPPSLCWDSTDGMLWVCMTTGTTSTAVWTPAVQKIPAPVIFGATGAFSWTVPAGITRIKAMVVGAGGGGSGNSPTNAGGGGGAGGLAYKWVAVTSGQTLTGSIGVGGTGGASGGGAGGTGGNTTLVIGALTITANGGAGGMWSSGGTVHTGGAGGTATNGDENWTGSEGVNAAYTSSATTGGTGAAGPFGGAGKAGSGAGDAATAPGAGGGASDGTAAGVGGAGANGYIRIEY